MDDQQVAAQLETILASEAFSRSARSRELLRYVVEEALAGRGDAINSKTIAQDVFGRDETFDASTDPLVRVQMGRTRALLDGWYDGAGGSAPIRISVPKGSYRPAFARNDEPAPERPVPATDDGEARAEPGPPPSSAEVVSAARVRPGHVVMATLAVMLAAVTTFVLFRPGGLARTPDYPVVIVRPFENMTGQPANAAFEKGLQRQIASDLQRFRTVRIALDDAPLSADDEPLTADYAVAGTILSISEEIDFVLNLIDLPTGEIVMRERLRRETRDGSYYDLLADLSSHATGRLLGMGGGVERREAERQEAAMGLPTAQDVSSFRCIVLFEELVRAKSPERARTTHECLTTALETRPEDASLMAALAWTTALVAPESGQLEAGPWAEARSLDEALALAERAVAIDPGNDFAHGYLALIQWRTGETGAAVSTLRRAVALNPGDPTHLADLGLYLGFSGKWGEGERMVRRSLERSGNPPAWYELTRMFRALIEGDGAEAQRIAAENATTGDPFSDVYELAAAVVARDEARIAELRPAVAELAARQGGDALREARPWIRSEQVLGTLEDKLAEAGVETRRAS